MVNFIRPKRSVRKKREYAKKKKKSKSNINGEHVVWVNMDTYFSTFGAASHPCSQSAHKPPQLLQHTSRGWKQQMINSEHNTFCRKDLTSNSALTAPSISTPDWVHWSCHHTEMALDFPESLTNTQTQVHTHPHTNRHPYRITQPANREVTHKDEVWCIHNYKTIHFFQINLLFFFIMHDFF